MSKEIIKVSETELKCLKVLVEEYDSEANCMYMRYIVGTTGLELKQVKRSVRALARKGLAEYIRGLMDDEGKVAGSGYCATEKGAKFINPCDDCGSVITFDWEENGKRIKLCSSCYEKRKMVKTQ